MIEGSTQHPQRGSSLFHSKARLVLIGGVLVLALAYFVYVTFPGSAMYYLTVDELAAETQAGKVVEGQRLRVVGNLVPDSFKREPGSLLASFSMVSSQGKVLNAQYDGPVPDTFFSPHNQIVLEGSYDSGGLFRADDVVVKCPSKFLTLAEEGGA